MARKGDGDGDGEPKAERGREPGAHVVEQHHRGHEGGFLLRREAHTLLEVDCEVVRVCEHLAPTRTRPLRPLLDDGR